MAIYKFITDKDIEVGLKKYFLDQVTAGAEHVIKICEAAAVSYMVAKLNNRYDISKLFPTITTWSGSTAFTIGQFCFSNDKIYEALTNNTNKNPATETADWKENDTRDQLLVVYCVNITIYFLLERINPRKISEDVMNAFASASEWLDDVKNGDENPAFPLLTDGASNIPYGSNEKIEHYY